MVGERLYRLFLVLSLAAVADAVGKAQEKKADERRGEVVGVAVAKSGFWVEVKADGEEKARRYVPHWRGGAPKDGGGPDKEMVAKLKEVPVNSRVRLEWVFEERPRVEKIEVLKKGDEKKTEGKKDEKKSEGEKPVKD